MKMFNLIFHAVYLSTAILCCIGNMPVAAESNCSCGYYDAFYNIGPFCARWVANSPPFCLLDGEYNASDCPGAIQWGNTSFYWTTDELVCAPSRNYTTLHCNCAHYEKLSWIGPYCRKWAKGYPEFCLLSGGPMGRFCPGAGVAEKNIYWTNDQTICKRASNFSKIRNLSFSHPLRPINGRKIAMLCLYLLTIVIGTIGNGFVVKYFAFGDASGRPGSRFIVVLAIVDFVTSIWIPSIAIFKELWGTFWPLGETFC